MSIYTDASLIVTPNAVKASKLYSLKGADLDVVRATSATRVNESGLIEIVGLNVPRIDYTNGSCPSILVEPQRTNLVIQSNKLNTTPWAILLSEVSINENYDISPDGTSNANKINFLSGSTRFTQIFTVTSNTTYTLSFWVKNIDATSVSISIPNTSSSSINYFPEISSDEWRRLSFTFTTNSGITSISPQITRDASIGKSILIYGVQLEEGSNATSYIPTTTASVTRNADIISKTGLSGITTITETFEDDTTNVISGSPTSYTMSEGRIKNVIGL